MVEQETTVSLKFTKDEFMILLASLLQSHNLFTEQERYIREFDRRYNSFTKMMLCTQVDALINKIKPKDLPIPF